MIIFEYIKLLYYLFYPDSIFVRWISHAMGDNLLLSVILPELRNKYPNRKIIVETKFPELFFNNPHIDWVTNKHLKTTPKFIKPKYRIFENTTKSIYAQILEYISSKKEGFPELFLTQGEIEKHKESFEYFAITPCGKQKFSANRKEWGLDKFQELVNEIMAKSNYKFIQIGTMGEKLLNGVIDKRGIAIRESTSVIKNSVAFIGLEGGLMHLAKAVNKNSVIIYGGFINPKVSEYNNNLNIVNLIECSPCFTSEKSLTNCDTMQCMNEISVEMVFEKIKEKYF
ncbi:MAG: glycosyltransferase family 9 protein [Ignavibacteriae bacterium]|nr:glycosyltransferase family 9 protein [Ignavibacteriota bacterium]